MGQRGKTSSWSEGKKGYLFPHFPVKCEFSFPWIYRTKFDAFSDIDNFSIISKFQFFDIDNFADNLTNADLSAFDNFFPIYRWPLAWIEHRNDDWQVEYKTDVNVGTYPEGSAWRIQGPYNDNPVIFKDHVFVPEDLEPGLYVLGWRWDAMSGAQVWVSCANIEIV